MEQVWVVAARMVGREEAEAEAGRAVENERRERRERARERFEEYMAEARK